MPTMNYKVENTYIFTLKHPNNWDGIEIRFYQEKDKDKWFPILEKLQEYIDNNFKQNNVGIS